MRRDQLQIKTILMDLSGEIKVEWNGNNRYTNPLCWHMLPFADKSLLIILEEQGSDWTYISVRWGQILERWSVVLSVNKESRSTITTYTYKRHLRCEHRTLLLSNSLTKAFKCQWTSYPYSFKDTWKNEVKATIMIFSNYICFHSLTDVMWVQ